MIIRNISTEETKVSRHCFFLFHALKHKFQALKYIFQTLKYMFQALKQKNGGTIADNHLKKRRLDCKVKTMPTIDKTTAWFDKTTSWFIKTKANCVGLE